MYYVFKVATAMFGYMTDLDTVDIVRTEEITAEGKLIIKCVLSHSLPCKQSFLGRPMFRRLITSAQNRPSVRPVVHVQNSSHASSVNFCTHTHTSV